MTETRVQTGLLAQTLETQQPSFLQICVACVQRILRVRPAGERTLRHVETLALGQRKCVYLIECDGQRYLVGDGVSAPVRINAGSSEEMSR